MPHRRPPPNPFASSPSPPNLAEKLKERLANIRDADEDYPIRLTVDESEECIRILWEFVGHMGDDVGTDGYEFRLLERARHWAQEIQLAVLAAVTLNAPQLLSEAREERQGRN